GVGLVYVGVVVVVYPVAGTGCGGWVSGPPEAAPWPLRLLAISTIAPRTTAATAVRSTHRRRGGGAVTGAVPQAGPGTGTGCGGAALGGAGGYGGGAFGGGAFGGGASWLIAICQPPAAARCPGSAGARSEERRVGKGCDAGGG